MYPPVYLICAADPDVQALLGVSPCRLYPFGEAPQPTPTPYVIWQTVSGSPEIYMDRVPDIERWTVQLDCYATAAQQVREVARALRDSIEPHAHIVSWRGEFQEPATNLYRLSFDVDWWTKRQ